MPLERLSEQQLVQGQVKAIDWQVTVHAHRNELLRKTSDTRVLLDQCPIEPGDFVVLAEGVIIAVLAAPNLVSHQQHGGSRGEQGRCQKILYLAIAQLL